MKSQEAFGIFEGGGAKGIALVGALQAIREAKIEFVGWGGTSAGAIVAALAAVGWEPGELKELLLSQDFEDFLDPHPGQATPTLADLRKLRPALEPLFAQLSQVKAGFFSLIALGWRLRSNPTLAAAQPLVKCIREKHGLFAGDAFRSWIEQKITEKSRKAAVTFKQLSEEKWERRHSEGEVAPLPEPLYIVSTHYRTRTARIYGAQHCEDAISDAVRASMSIPLLFSPFHDQVDGGLISNFPSWVFDELKAAYGSIPTIGVKLVPQEKETPKANDVAQYLNYILASALEGKDELDVGDRRDMYVIEIDVGDIGTCDFDISPHDRRKLYENGYRAAQAMLQSKHLGLTNDAGYAAFAQIAENAKKIMGRLALRWESSAEPRCNLFVAEGATYRLRYHLNMDTDPDRRVVLHNNEGAVAVASKEPRLVITDASREDPIFWVEKADHTGFELERGLSAHFLTKEHEEIVNKAKFIISHSVLSPDSKEIVGVFNVDTVQKGEELGLLKSAGELDEAKAKQLAEHVRSELSHLGTHLK